MMTTSRTVPETHDDGKGPLFEIVDGEKVEKTMSLYAQYVGSEICGRIRQELLEEGIGGFVVTEAFIACFEWAPKTRRRPDVAYWREDQYPDGIPLRGDAAVAPAWVVEVVSPGDLSEDLEAKIAEYFRAGIGLVWIVHPGTRTIRAEQPDGTAHVYRNGDAIDAAPVLPNLRMKASEVFPKATSAS